MTLLSLSPTAAGQAEWLEAVGVILTPSFSEALFAESREKIVTGGWQSGKSTEAAAEIWRRLPFHEPHRKEPYIYWIVGPTYQGAHREFDYLFDWAASLDMVVGRPLLAEDGMRRLVLLGGTVIETRSSQHPERLASDAIDGAVVVEAGQQPESTRMALQGRIMARRGWLTYTGTLEDDEAHERWAWYGELAELWHSPGQEGTCFALPSWANPVAYPDGESDPEIGRLRRVLDPHTFSRRIAAIPTGVENPMYPALRYKSLLVPMRTDYEWRRAGGGSDYGTTPGHESALVVVAQNSLGAFWVRAS